MAEGVLCAIGEKNKNRQESIEMKSQGKRLRLTGIQIYCEA